MPEAQLDVLINSVANTAGFATAKAELSALAGGGFTPLGGGTVNFGGSLTREEQAVAAAQLSTLETRSKAAAVAARDLASEGNNVARAMSAMGVQGAEAGGRLTALAGVMGSSGALGIGIGAAIIGLGAAYEAGKSMMENADKNEAAQRNLAQAFTTQGKVLGDYQSGIDEFISKNQSYISSQYDVKNAFADSIRAGNDYNTTLRLVNDALDLSTTASIPLSTAMDDLIKLKTGRASQEFAAMGIQIKGAVDPAKELAKAHKELTTATNEKTKADRALYEEEVRLKDKGYVTANDLLHLQDLKAKDAAATQRQADATKAEALAKAELNDKGNLYAQQLDEVESKVKGMRDNTTDLQKAQHNLNADWERLSNDYGPTLNVWATNFTELMGGAVTNTDNFLNALSHNDWSDFDNALIGTIKHLQDFTTSIGNAYAGFVQFTGLGTSKPGVAPRGNPARGAGSYGSRTAPPTPTYARGGSYGSLTST